MLYGIDAHVTYQDGLNIEQLAREGFSFVCVKATQGSGGYTAPATFDDWINRTRAAGMIAGAYHWLDSSDPVRQADRFIGRLAPVGGPDGLLLQIDCEDTAVPATAWHLEQFVAQLRRRAPGHPLLLYTGRWWWQPRMGGYDAAALGLKLWHSSYVAGAGIASTLLAAVTDEMWAPGYGGWPHATILQFSDKGTAGGLVANVDVNAFNGARDELLALTTATSGDDMTWDQAAAILGGTVQDGFADNTNVKSVPDYVKPNVGYNLKNISSRLDVMTAALGDAKARDAATAVTIAALQATVTKLTDTLTALTVGGVSVQQLDGPTLVDALTATIKSEAAAVRDLVERRHADELAQLQHDRNAEVSGLLAEVAALRAQPEPGA